MVGITPCRAALSTVVPSLFSLCLAPAFALDTHGLDCVIEPRMTVELSSPVQGVLDYLFVVGLFSLLYILVV